MSDDGHVLVQTEKLKPFMLGVLDALGVRPGVALSVVDGLLHASLRGVDSHGVRLLPHYLRAVESGRINPDPDFRFEQKALAVGRLDADHTFGIAAGVEGMSRAIKIARDAGTGSVSVYNSTHFGAAAFFALMAPEHNMIGMSFTNTDALMVPTGGVRRFMGNSPMCFAVPCATEEPFCLDMATSAVTWNRVLQLRESNGELEPQWCVDEDGNETTDPHKAAGLWPIGGYKGYGLSVMIETLCSVLGGMPFGPHIVPMFAGPIEEKRLLGHFFMAIRIDAFLDPDEFKSGFQQMLNELRAEARSDEGSPVMVAGDPEKASAAERARTGVPLAPPTVTEFRELSRRFNIPLELPDA
jgi:ureidoglycolate dehydrogenase (NAD+)